jgi:hypothetical protein
MTLSDYKKLRRGSIIERERGSRIVPRVVLSRSFSKRGRPNVISLRMIGHSWTGKPVAGYDACHIIQHYKLVKR